MNYLVAGPSIVNDIVFRDGTISRRHLGGAVFCLAGIKIWSDSCLYLSNVGPDFRDFYGEWMDANGFSEEGLRVILPHTYYTVLRYGDQGLFAEECVYGPEEDELILQLDRPDAGWIAENCDGQTKGIYIEACEDDAVWDEIHMIKAGRDIKIMWEIPTDSALDPGRRAAVFSTIQKAGLYSINLPEASCLFQAEDEADAISRILGLGVPCYFRVGAKGSYFLCGGSSYFAPSLTVGEITDPTGCGNCSTAAASMHTAKVIRQKRLGL